VGITVDGADIVFTGTLRLVNGFNPDTGVAYMILTPDGGTGAIPFLAEGQPGLPPVFDSMTLIEVDPADPLPTPNPVKTVVDPGGPGLAAHYTLTFYLHKGATGLQGANEISTAVDLATSPALSANTNAYILVYDATNQVWVPTSQKVGDSYVPSAFASTAFNTASPRTLASVTVPPMPFDWRPKCFGQVIVTGSSDTRVDLYARINNAASGDQVGYSKGVAGASPPPNILIPAAPVGSAVGGSGTYGRVLAGQQAVIYLRAEQKAASNSSWSTSGAPDSTFWVDVSPLL
jgi:hypothetical protein